MIPHMEIILDNKFDVSTTGQPFQARPTVFYDNRGAFAEQWYCGSADKRFPGTEFLDSLSWVKQINRSVSKSGVVRGMHAQTGSFCQGKLVEAVHGSVYDIVVDARPDSSTFGKIAFYLLDAENQAKLWIPRGFLHGFIVPLDCPEATFQYFTDAPYCRDSEISCSPIDVLRHIADGKAGADARLAEAATQALVRPGLAMSEKDRYATPMSGFLSRLAASRRRWWELGSDLN